MIKILFTVNSIGLEIPSNISWNGNPITQMEESHVKNTIAWCHRRAESFKACNLTEEKLNGYTFTQWKAILLAELKRRKQEEIQLRKEQIRKELEQVNPQLKIQRLEKELFELEKEMIA